MTSSIDAGKLFSEFKWVLEEYDYHSCGHGLSSNGLRSPKFTVGNVQWFMEFYPKNLDGSSDYCSFFLYASTEIKADVTVEIKTQQSKICEINSKSMKYTPAGHFTDTFNQAGCGCRNFLHNGFIHQLTYMRSPRFDYKINIICKINLNAKSDYIHDLELKKVSKDISRQLATIDKYESLIDDDQFGNVLLISEGQSIKVNKSLLAKSSSVFAAMFVADMKEKQNSTVDIVDVKYNVLLEMIRFVYAGKVNRIDTIAMELSAVAEKYALDELKEMCEESIIKNLTISNAISRLVHANTYRMDKLKKKGIELIVSEADKVSGQEFKLLSPTLMTEIFLSLSVKKSTRN